MQETGLVLTLATGFGAALVFGYITQRLGLSPIVGYLLAGVVVGPNTPGFVADADLAEQLAEIGVILLMFGVGLQFHLEELLAVRRDRRAGRHHAERDRRRASVRSPRTRSGGRGRPPSSSAWRCRSPAPSCWSACSRTAAQLHTSAGHIAVGWLVVEDVLTVIVLVLLPTFSDGRRAPALSR